MQEADLTPGAKMFTRLVALQPTPSPWPSVRRLALELVALVAASTVLFGCLAMAHT